MALTRVTSTVVDSNAVSSEKLANGSITSRSNSSILLEHLGSTSPSAQFYCMGLEL